MNCRGASPGGEAREGRGLKGEGAGRGGEDEPRRLHNDRVPLRLCKRR